MEAGRQVRGGTLFLALRSLGQPLTLNISFIKVPMGRGDSSTWPVPDVQILFSG